MSALQLSVVIPVYNEEAGLDVLFARLYPALDALNLSYEIIFINDGSRDRSAAMLREQYERRPEVTRVVLLAGNFGQHMAIMAGFSRCRGERIVTLDADLQNPPEEIGKLLARMDEGYDYVGGVRQQRQDSSWRRYGSWAMNHLRERITHVVMSDQGCMLRAYSREVIAAINNSHEVNTFIPALAYTYARNPGEVQVAHEERAAGESKYSLYNLIRLNFDLVTGLFAGAVANILDGRAGIVAAVRTAGRLPRSAPHLSGAGSGRRVHPVCDCVFPAWRGAVRHWPAGRIHRAHLPAGAPASALSDRSGAGADRGRKTVTRAVVFAYHDVGVRCLSVLLDAGVEVALVVTHTDAPGDTIWFDSVAQLAARYDIPTVTPTRP